MKKFKGEIRLSLYRQVEIEAETKADAKERLYELQIADERKWVAALLDMPWDVELEDSDSSGELTEE